MNRRQKIIVSVVGIFIVLLALVGLTYAYFLTQIKGNTNNKSISVTTANLRLVYGGDDGSIIGDNEIIEPDTTFATKTFTVTNTGNETIDSYAVVIENFGVYYNEDSTIIENNVEVPVYKDDITTLARPDDFKLVITCKNQAGKECTGFNGSLPRESSIMLTNSIEKNEVQTYTATLKYIEANENQSADMNKRIEGKFNIIGLSDTVDLTGTVENYENGDYVQTNSTKRVSTINPDGTYKVLGLEAGTHKIKVCGKGIEDCTDEQAKLVEEINIVQGDTASGNNTTKTITITEDSREATVNVNVTGEVTINDEINDYNPFDNKNSLAYNIYANAKKETNGTSLVYETTSDIGYRTSSSFSGEYKESLVEINTDELCEGFDTWVISDTMDGEIDLNGGRVSSYDEAVGKYVYSGCEGWTKYLMSYDKNTSTLTFKEYTPIYKYEQELGITQDDYGTSYFFRGKPNDNYVNFANKCWRIVRIAGDGSVKLILLDKNQTCNSKDENGNLNMDKDWNIPTTTGGTITTGNYGYTSYAAGEYIADDGTSNNKEIMIKDYLHGKTNSETSMATAFKNFQSTFTNSELSKMKSGDWCMQDNAYLNGNYNDILSDSELKRRLIKNANLSSFDVKTSVSYDAKTRLDYGSGKYQYYPTLKCTGYIMNDWDDLNKTFMYVSALTADELVYAGAMFAGNSNFYLAEEYREYWFLTPYHNLYVTDYATTLTNSTATSREVYGRISVSFRPAINLAKGTTILEGGNGTISNPYVIN